MKTSFVESSQTPDLITLSGSASVTTTATMLTASQSYGTFETDDGSVPFRYNTATNGTMTVSVGLSGNYERNLSDGSNEITYDAAANLNRTMAGSTRESSYVGIIGDLSGYHLEKSTGGLNETISVSATDDNGATSATGNFTRSTNGTTDSLTSLSGTDVSQPGVSVSIEFFENGGGKFSDGYSGSFTEDTSESTDEFAIGGMSQSVYGNSVTKTTAFRVLPEGTSLSTSFETTKFLANVDGSGAVQSHDDEIVSQSGQYSSDRFLRATSDQTLFATSSSTEGNTFTTATLFFGSSTKFQLVGGEGASLLSVGDFEQTNGGMHSKTTVNAKTNGLMIATAETSDGSTSESATMSSSFGNRLDITDQMGGYFINDIIVVGASGSDESLSRGQSTITITQTAPDSTLTQTISQTDASSDTSSYAVNLMQFGDIVGSVSGTYSASTVELTVTQISSSGNSQFGSISSWQSRQATVTDQFKLSAGGVFYGLEGTNDGDGDQTNGPLSSGNWSVSNSHSIDGTITKGSFYPIATTINGIEETGFTRHESTQHLNSTDGVSASDISPVPTITSNWTIDGVTVHQSVTASAVVDDDGDGGDDGGGEPLAPGGVGGGGISEGETQTAEPLGGAGENWQSAHADTTTTKTLISMSETTTGNASQRSITQATTHDRVVSEQTSTDDGLDRTSRRVAAGNGLEYTGGVKGEWLVRTQFNIEQTQRVHEDFVEDGVVFEDGEMKMNDWIETYSHAFQWRAEGNAARFTHRNKETLAYEYDGSVNYSYKTDYNNDNDASSSGETSGATTADRQINITTSHEVITSGPFGLKPTLRKVIDRSAQQTDFNSLVTHESNVTQHKADGDHTSVSKSRTKIESEETSERKTTTTSKRDAKPTTEFFSKVTSEKETDSFSSGHRTSPTGTPWDYLAFSYDLETYESTIRNDRPAKGFRTKSGYSFDSMLCHVSIEDDHGDGCDPWTRWNTTTTWPEGGETPGDGTTDGDGGSGSYDPSSMRQTQDDDFDGNQGPNLPDPDAIFRGWGPQIVGMKHREVQALVGVPNYHRLFGENGPIHGVYEAGVYTFLFADGSTLQLDHKRLRPIKLISSLSKQGAERAQAGADAAAFGAGMVPFFDAADKWNQGDVEGAIKSAGVEGTIMAVTGPAGKVLGWVFKPLAKSGLGDDAVRVVEDAIRIADDDVSKHLDEIGRTVERLVVLNKTCFVANTPILTPDGYKPIQDFKPGDAILSRPEDQPEASVRPSVVEVLFELASPILELHLGGQIIETTAEHPFYVAEKGWVRAEMLESGDLLIGHDDQLTEVESVTSTNRHETVYNVRVANDHTYFVGDEDWGFSVWVHNAYSVRQLADGTFEIIDGSGDVVRTGLKSADEANLLAKTWSALGQRAVLPPGTLPKDFAGKVPAVLKDGQVYVHRFHHEATKLANGGKIPVDPKKFLDADGWAQLDEFGKVIDTGWWWIR